MKFLFSISFIICLFQISNAQNNPIFGFGNAAGDIAGCYSQVSPLGSIHGFGNADGDATGCYAQVSPLGSIHGFGNADGNTTGCFAQISPFGSIQGFGNASGSSNGCYTQYYGLSSGNSIFGFGNAAGYVSGCNISMLALPVTLLNFKASYILTSKSVLLNWKVAHENLIDRYEILRSENMRTWNVVSEVKCKKDFSSMSQYETVDDDIILHRGQELYYQLKVYDLNGTVSATAFDVVKLTETLKIRFNNPVEKLLHLSFENQIEQQKRIEIFSIVGAHLTSIKINSDVAQIDLSDFVSGYYIMIVYLNDEVVGRYKLIKN